MKKIKDFASFLNENIHNTAQMGGILTTWKPKSKLQVDYKLWLKEFEEFLDHVWQEDSEIEIVDMLSEYRDRFKADPKGTYEYFTGWVKANKNTLDSILSIKTSDKFASMFDKLAMTTDDIKEENKGLWANIRAKKKRGEAPAKPGDKDYPKKDAWKNAQK